MIYCIHCGHRLPTGGNFCPNCGARLTEAPLPGSAQPFYAPPAAPIPCEPTPLPNEERPFEQPRIDTTPPQNDPATMPYAPAPAQYAPAEYPQPLASIQPLSTRPAKPVDPMSRAYRLTTLGTAGTYGMVSEVSQIVIAVAAFLCILFSMGGSSLNAFDSVSDLLENDSLIRTLLWAYLLAYVGGLLLGILVSKTIRRRLPAQPPERKSLPLGAFLGCALAAFGLWGVGIVLGNFPAFLVPIDTMSFGWSSVPVWILTIVVAPIFEELIFRKLVLDRVGVFGEAPAVLCSALIFGLAHQNAGQFFLAFLLGILFARIYLRTGNIVYTMLLHFMINLTATLEEVGLLLWGEAFDLWYLIALGVLTLAGVVLLILYRRDPIIGLPGRLTPEERQRSLRCWPVTMVKWICIVTILGTGLAYAVIGVTGLSFFGDWDPEPLGLLYLVPAILAVVFILILTRRPKPQPTPAEPLPPRETV